MLRLSAMAWWDRALQLIGRLAVAVFGAAAFFFAGLGLSYAADQGPNRALVLCCDAIMLILPPVVFVALLLTRRGLFYLLLVLLVAPALTLQFFLVRALMRMVFGLW